MRIALYANDLGPAKNLAMIANEATQQGHRVSFVGNDKLALVFADPGSAPDVAVTGLSSFENKAEIALGIGMNLMGKPWLVVADTHKSWARPAAGEVAAKAILLVATPCEVEAAKTFGYSRVEYLGGPPFWQELWNLKPHAERLHPAFTVYVSGIKSPDVTDEFLAAVVDGVRLVLQNDWVLIFRPHPNEDRATELTTIEMFRMRRKEIFEGVNLLKTDVPSPVAAISADISFFTSGATDTITCAMHRRVACYYESPAVRTRMKQQTGEEMWYPAEIGAVLKVQSAAEIARAVQIAESGDTRVITELNRQQNAAYPLPEPGQRVEKKIISFLKELAQKK